MLELETLEGFGRLTVTLISFLDAFGCDFRFRGMRLRRLNMFRAQPIYELQAVSANRFVSNPCVVNFDVLAFLSVSFLTHGAAIFSRKYNAICVLKKKRQGYLIRQ